MRVLILGGGGMLGHKLWQVFREGFDTYVTVRQNHTAYAKYGIFDPTKMRSLVDVQDFATFERTFEELRPNVAINCIGVVKQLPLANDPIVSIETNSLFPHRIARLCGTTGTYLVHLSTDCVFSGRGGMYSEEDLPDPVDLYGKTKLLGEVTQEGCLTIRTSMLGRELTRRLGLLEWFLSQDGKRINGFVNVTFSGLTTLALGRIIAQLCSDFKGLSGLYHISSHPISKHDLLLRLRDRLGLSAKIVPTEVLPCDRSLNSSKFWCKTGLRQPVWDEMLEELIPDTLTYEPRRLVPVKRLG